MYLIITGILAGIFIGLGGHTIVKETVMDKYRRFRSLNKLVSSQYKNICMILWVSIQLICKSLYLSFVQWINNSVVKVDKHRYEVSYLINGRLYKMVVKPVRGPAPILLVTDEECNNVTDLVIPYMGVQRDFHGVKITPQFLGYKELTLELDSGETIVLDETEVLRLE